VLPLLTTYRLKCVIIGGHTSIIIPKEPGRKRSVKTTEPHTSRRLSFVPSTLFCIPHNVYNKHQIPDCNPQG
jgi:hypothetical protein